MPSVYSIIREYSVTQANKPALIDNSTIYSYKDFNAQIYQLADEIKHRIGSGKCVGILSPNCAELVFALLSIPLSGNIAFPIDANVSEQTLNTLIAKFSLSQVLTHPKLLRFADSFPGVDFINLEELLSNCSSFLSEDQSEVNPEDTAYVYCTTGSTGVPKGVILTHRNVLASARNISRYMGLDSSVVESLPMPLSHSFGFGRLRSVIISGGCVIIENGLILANRVIQNIKKYKVNSLSMVPVAYELFLNNYYDYFKKIAHQLRYIELGSSSMNLNSKMKLREACPDAFICMHYGSTEASRSTFINFANKEELETIGKPPEGVEVRIMGEDDQVVNQPNQLGEIIVSGDMVANEYWQDPELSAIKFRKGSYYTGDLAAYDECGNLHFLGRKEDVVNVGGYKVAAADVEKTVSSFDAVKEVAVFGAQIIQQTSAWDIVAVIVPNNEIVIQELEDFLSSRLESYKLPAKYIVVEALPKTNNGKVEKHKLKDLLDE